MTYIGEFGAERPEADFSFGYFGSVLRVHPDLTAVAVLNLFAEIDAISKAAADDTEAMSKAFAAVRSIASTLVHPDDADEFWTLARQHRQTLEDLGELAMKMLEAITERPTSRPSDSSDGPSATSATSEGASPSPALRLLQSRPDLAVAVLQAEEARTA